MSSGRLLQPPAESLVKRCGSPTPAEDDKTALEHALDTFQSTLSDEERTRFDQMKSTTCDADAVIKFTHDLDGLNGRRGRSIATKVYSFLQTIQQFYQVIETYVSSHPEIAALVWGSVKLTFLIMANFVSYFEKFSELLGGFDQLCPRFAEYRVLFPDSKRLRQATYKFHAAIILCCSQIITVTRRPWKQQLLTILTQNFQSEIRPYVENIQAKAKHVQKEMTLAKAQADQREQQLQAEERSQAADSRGKLSKWFSHSDRELRGIRKGQDAKAKKQKWEMLLIKLSSYDHAAAFKSARSKRHNGTAEWAFPTEQFQNWLDGENSSILHFTGKIGSGKTVLTANVVDYLIKNRTRQQLVSFFFVRFDDVLSLNTEHILRCLIRQALDHSSADDALLDHLEAAETAFFDIDALIELWAEKAKSMNNLFIVVDGLDECYLSERTVFLDCLSKLRKAISGYSRVKILLSSRETIVDEVDQSDMNVSRLSLSDANICSDLSRYAEEVLEQKISRKQLIIRDKKLMEEVFREIKRGGEGMFLWVFLTVEDVCTRRSDPEIRKALRNIPRSLSGIFNRALARITANGNEEIARNTFRWTATVRRPLTLDQLQEALAVEVGQKYSQPEHLINGINRITAWCENMVHVEETDDTVHFSHHSIRKYLLEPKPGPHADFHIDIEDWDHHVGEVCMTYLNFNDFKTTLMKSPGDKLGLATDYLPAGIAGEAVRTALPGTSSARLVRFVHRAFKRPLPHSVSLQQPQEPTFEDLGSENTSAPNHPFLLYAVDEWLFHTVLFTPLRSETWTLWQAMISSENAPWMELEWQPPGMHQLDYAKWLDSDDFAMHETKRSSSIILHKAIVYADFIGHHMLMAQLVLGLRDLGILIYPPLLQSFLSSRKAYTYSNGLRLNRTGHKDERSDPRDNHLDLVTEFIAWGGEFWPASHTDLHLACQEDHRYAPGVHSDICIKREFELAVAPWMQVFAQLSIMEINESLFEDVKRGFGKLMRSKALYARSQSGKTVVSITLEQSGEWPRALADWFLRKYEETCPPIQKGALARDSVRYALKNGDWVTAQYLFEMGGKSWSRLESVDHELISYATQYRALPFSLRAPFIRTCIPTLDSMPSNHSEERADRNLALFNAARRRSWDIAVALYRSGARLQAAKGKNFIVDEKACQILNSAFTCVGSNYFFKCNLETISGAVLKPLRLCPKHLSEAQELKPALDDGTWAEEVGAKILLSILDNHFIYLPSPSQSVQ